MTLGTRAADQIVFIRLKPKGSKVEQSDMLGMLKSAKWVGPIESPISGKIIEVNEQLRKQPRLVSSSPYDD